MDTSQEWTRDGRAAVFIGGADDVAVDMGSGCSGSYYLMLVRCSTTGRATGIGVHCSYYPGAFNHGPSAQL